MTASLESLGLSRSDLPLIVSPMFLVSNPDLVTACCRNGVVGSFPTLNQRTTEGFDAWLKEIRANLDASEGANPIYGVNLVVHSSNPRQEADLEICIENKVPVIITSLGAVPEVIDRVHAYGGIVLHDVVNIRHARKAVEAGVDGLVLVCAGAGGHGGLANPFAFLEEVRGFFDGLVGLAGGITSGQGVAAAVAAGADFAYVGTRFIPTVESMAPGKHKQMMLEAELADIIYTDAISGIPGNFLRQSIEAAGVDPQLLISPGKVDLGSELKPGSKAWKDIWAAGQGVGAATTVESAADVIQRLRAEYQDTIRRFQTYAA